MTRKILAASLALMVLSIIWASSAKAQILMVTGEYRVTHVDRSEQRIGIALRDADPNKRQNWVYIKASTKIVRRVWMGDGTFRDEEMRWNEFFDYVRKGTLIKVHGGRDWDGTIDAKKIWL